MNKKSTNQYSASEQALGYMYQSRIALFRLLQLPEDVAVLIEKDDDIEFFDDDNNKTLVSLKHKAEGDHLTDLSIDFWKSIRIWLSRYNRDGKTICHLRFFLLTTSKVSEDSFLVDFLLNSNPDYSLVTTHADFSLSRTTSSVIEPIRSEFDLLSISEKSDFLSRITIFDNSPRINDVPDLIISQYMRTVRREFRKPVFDHLEGWWNSIIIDILTGARTTEVYGHEISDKLSMITDEYKTDNLPINFRGVRPNDIDPIDDPRLFVHQLREIGLQPNRIQNAICDYYRAFEQRSSWARENVLVEGEVEEFEDRLVDEWGRYRDIIFESIDKESADSKLIAAGRELYNWAEMNSDHIRIRERVAEPYVTRGNFHILANYCPIPRVFWHPTFLDRIDDILLRRDT